jgi:crotonobetainyl-CoA:carnitine CoA-transferase CaiB-like acyl-CoA transferase
MAGRILALLGAEVIHVEPAGNLDTWRSYTGALVLKRYPNCEPGERRYNRAALFNSQNTDKLSFSLDLKAPGGKEVFRDLIKESDVLLANFTPGMLVRLGLSNEELWKINPRLCVVELPAYGNTGPMSTWAALGPTMEQTAGMCAIVGYGDGKPVPTGPAYLDPMGGYHGAAAVLTALYHRQQTGQPQYIEVPQVEAAMNTIGEILISAAETGLDPIIEGNRLTTAAPHDIFPTVDGEDEWVAIHVASDEDWKKLCRIVGNAELSGNRALDTLEGRLAHQDEVDAILSEWTRPQSKHAVAKALQDAGVMAAAVYKANDILDCDYLNARQFSRPLAHPEAGTHLQQGLPFRFELTPVQHRRAAPCLGEHNDYILRDVLGRSETEIADLEAAGTTRSAPDA